MFNWLISSKKKDYDSETCISKSYEKEEETVNYFTIPGPPDTNLELAEKIKKQNYNYLYRDNLNSDIVEEYHRRQRTNNFIDIDKKLHNLLMSIVFMELEQKNNRITMPKYLKLEIQKEYDYRKIVKDDKNLHKILMKMVCNEIISMNDNINVTYFEWSSEESESENISGESDQEESDQEESEIISGESESDQEESESEEYISKEYVSRMKRLRQELPVIDWEKKIKEWDINFPEKFEFTDNPVFNTDIEMGFPAMEEIVVDNGLDQVEKFRLTEEDMYNISKEIGNSWEKLDDFPNYEDFQILDFPVKETETINKTKMKTIKEHPEGYLELFVGPMYSGKSSKVLFKLTSMADQRFNCLYINSIKDERETESQDDFVTTHNSSYSRTSPKINCVKVSSLKEVSVSDYDYIGIDELQFFNDEDTVKCINDWVSVYGKHVLIASLDGDCYRRRFGKVLELIPNADEVTKLTAYCDLCRDNYGVVKKAPFTARMTSDTSAELVGGRNLYKAMCRSCHEFHLNITAINEC